MTGKMYGYARVSSKEQNLNRQLDALAEFGVADDMVFADKASGKKLRAAGIQTAYFNASRRRRGRGC